MATYYAQRASLGGLIISEGTVISQEARGWVQQCMQLSHAYMRTSAAAAAAPAAAAAAHVKHWNPLFGEATSMHWQCPVGAFKRSPPYLLTSRV
jgi:hypothetical protein